MNIPTFTAPFSGKPWQTDGFPCGFPPGARWGNAAASGAALFPRSATGRDCGSLGDVFDPHVVSLCFNPLAPFFFLCFFCHMNGGWDYTIKRHKNVLIAGHCSFRFSAQSLGSGLSSRRLRSMEVAKSTSSLEVHQAWPRGLQHVDANIYIIHVATPIAGWFRVEHPIWICIFEWV